VATPDSSPDSAASSDSGRAPTGARRLEVDLGERSYPILIGPGILAEPACWQPHIHGRQVLVVSNDTVAPLYLDAVEAALAGFDLHRVILPDGEQYKDLDTLNRIFDALLEARLGRDVTLVALGGGVVGDMAGFAAACYQRGVAFDLPDGFEGKHAILSGNFPTGCTEYSLWRSVLRAPQFASALFRALWRQLGGTIQGGLRIAATPADAQPLLTYRSLPLNDQVRAINKWSNNPMTRHLLLTLGLEHAGPPGTPEKGRAAVAEWLRTKGLAMPGLYLDNGSGLSRDTRVTAAGLGAMLLDAWRHPQMADFIASMPIAAYDGTLRRRYQGDMAGRLSMKTGRLDDVSAIAGVVQSRSGQRFVVVVALNAENAHRGIGEAVQDTVLRWVFER